MLPSEESARLLIQEGWRTALPAIGKNVLERSTLIALGLGLVGVRPPWRVVLGAVAGALVVEVAVIDFVWKQDARAAGLVAPELPAIRGAAALALPRPGL